jgi:DNA-binding FadR family transcriptional regulator
VTSAEEGALRMASLRAVPLKLSDRVVAELQRRILSGDLRPDTRLPTETELGAMLGVSRTVIRDSLRTLAALGLVEVRQGRGTVVSAPTDGVFSGALVVLLLRSDLTMGDVIAARAAIETNLVPLAALQATPEDWDFLQARLDAFVAAVDKGEWQRAHDEHLGFHLGLLGAIRLPALEILLRPLGQVILASSVPPSGDDTSLWEVPSHPPILAALRARDQGGVREALRGHFASMASPAYAAFRATLFRDGPRVDNLYRELSGEAAQ